MANKKRMLVTSPGNVISSSEGRQVKNPPACSIRAARVCVPRFEKNLISGLVSNFKQKQRVTARIMNAQKAFVAAIKRFEQSESSSLSGVSIVKDNARMQEKTNPISRILSLYIEPRLLVANLAGNGGFKIA